MLVDSVACHSFDVFWVCQGVEFLDDFVIVHLCSRQCSMSFYFNIFPVSRNQRYKSSSASVNFVCWAIFCRQSSISIYFFFVSVFVCVMR